MRRRYGFSGGPSNAGVVYKLNASGIQSVLYGFTGGADGYYPTAGVILDPAGNLYGTTVSGGASNDGVVYELPPQLGGAWTEKVLYSFTGGSDGGYPYAGLVIDPAGNLYGTTLNGGTANVGVVYEVDSTGNYTSLYSFAGGPPVAIRTAAEPSTRSATSTGLLMPVGSPAAAAWSSRSNPRVRNPW
jgi:uncharacterized repeat protein (TIGR03803 family)